MLGASLKLKVTPYWEITCGLYYEHIMIINDDTSIVKKFEASLTDDASHNLQSSHVYSRGHWELLGAGLKI